MNSKEYWQKRQQEYQKKLEKDEEKLKKRLSRIYDAEAEKLKKEIAAYYSEYGKDDVIRYRDLLGSLDPVKKQMLYERAEAFMAENPEYADLMPIRESIYKLDRLEGLEASVQIQQAEIFAKETALITAHLNKVAEQAYNNAAKLAGAGTYNKNIAKAFVNIDWGNGNRFSDRIWTNKQKLVGYIKNDLGQGFARGDNYKKLTKQIQERMGNVSRKDAYRLIYTEGTYVMNEASISAFEDAGYKKYSISCLPGACDICTSLEGEVFNIKDKRPGTNFPPLHPYCKCTYTIEDDI